MNRHQQSIPFFLDHEKVFLKEKWFDLLINTRKNLLKCYSVLKDNKKVLNYLLLLAATRKLSSEVRQDYFNQSLDLCKNINEQCIFSMNELIYVDRLSLKTQEIISLGSTLELTIHLESYFLQPISVKFAKVCLSCKPYPKSQTISPNNQSCQSNQNDKMPTNINIEPQFETYQEHNPTKVGVKCPNVNRYFRKIDESFKQLDESFNDVEDSYYFYADDLTILPGSNLLTLTFKVSQYGCYKTDKFELLLLNNIHLTQKSLHNELCFSVISLDSSPQTESAPNSLPTATNSEINIVLTNGEPTKMRFIRLDNKASLLNQ